MRIALVLLCVVTSLQAQLVSRRAAAGGVDDPTDIANLALWFDASDSAYKDSALSRICISDGDSVTGWKDKSGNANNGYKPILTNVWTWETADQNGLAGIKIPITTPSVMPLLNNVALGTTAFYAVMVMKRVADNASVIGFGGDGYSYMVHYQDDKYYITSPSANIYVSPTGNNVSGTAITEWICYGTGNKYAVYHNGAKFDSSVATGGSIQVDQIASRTTSPYETQSTMYEMILYTSLPSLADRVALVAYLNTKWAVY